MQQQSSAGSASSSSDTSPSSTSNPSNAPVDVPSSSSQPSNASFKFHQYVFQNQDPSEENTASQQQSSSYDMSSPMPSSSAVRLKKPTKRQTGSLIVVNPNSRQRQTSSSGVINVERKGHSFFSSWKLERTTPPSPSSAAAITTSSIPPQNTSSSPPTQQHVSPTSSQSSPSPQSTQSTQPIFPNAQYQHHQPAPPTTIAPTQHHLQQQQHSSPNKSVGAELYNFHTRPMMTNITTSSITTSPPHPLLQQHQQQHVSSAPMPIFNNTSIEATQPFVHHQMSTQETYNLMWSAMTAKRKTKEGRKQQRSNSISISPASPASPSTFGEQPGSNSFSIDLASGSWPPGSIRGPTPPARGRSSVPRRTASPLDRVAIHNLLNTEHSDEDEECNSMQQ